MPFSPEVGLSSPSLGLEVADVLMISAISAFTDFYLAVYPAVVLMKLNMSSRKKIALCLALGLGSV